MNSALQGLMVNNSFYSEFNQEDQKLYVVMERGETDLSTLFRTLSKEGTLPPLKIKFYWLEMLETVQDLHQAGKISVFLTFMEAYYFTPPL